jgi:hypothetical protein
MMRIFCTFIFMALSLPCHANTLVLGTFQDETGAITVTHGGNSVDPYFATKALLLARDGGIDVNIVGRKWIEWAIKHQQENGLFSRYCRATAGAEWRHCEAADADDALLALWLELLYALAPNSGMPTSWKASAAKAEKQLALLYDTQTGLYHISEQLPASLLMDNVEIVAAFTSISKDMRRLNQKKAAAAMRKRADELARNIEKNFWQVEQKTYKITTQSRDKVDFYPDHVAQLFPLLYDLSVPSEFSSKAQFARWMKDHQSDWLDGISVDFPWGLVAVAATKFADGNTAFCWQSRAEPFRYSKNWNVLEEAALQRVQSYLKKHPPTVKSACMEALYEK